MQKSIIITAENCSSLGDGWSRVTKLQGKFIRGTERSGRLSQPWQGAGEKEFTITGKTLPFHGHKVLKLHKPNRSLKSDATQEGLDGIHYWGRGGADDSENLAMTNQGYGGAAEPIPLLPEFISMNFCEFNLE